MVTVISTFAGGGGSSLGYQWAGFTELLAIDFDKNSCDTLKANFDFPVWQRDITTVTAEEIFDFCKIKKGDLDVLDGSPPCQGFSTAGKRNLNDSRNDLFKDFVRLIDGLQPKVFVMENVSGMIKGGYKGKFNEIMQALKNTGYNVKCKLMNAMWYEVPQSRERVFFIGVRNDLNIEPSYPKPLNKVITFKEAVSNIKIEDVPDLTPSVKKYVHLLKEGQCLSDVGGKGFQTVRIYENKPCPALTKLKAGIGFGMLIHPLEDRVLTVAEMKRCSTFPDNYNFLGKWIEAKERIGNAVMPKMMFHIAKHIKENILWQADQKQ